MRISLILPYFNRKEAAYKALLTIAKAYAGSGLDLEVIVVDDGSAEPYSLPVESGNGINFCTMRLPRHDAPLSPVVPWNRGVEAATGDVIVLSCVEILHTMPVLAQMAAELQLLGPQGYVLAAAWCPEEARWHCHTEVKVEGCPRGTGRSFLGMMYKAHYQAIGGFDAEYRDGAGYEDIDFIKRLLRAKTKFLIRDDLVVTHPKENATTQWPAGAFERNKKLLHMKWPPKPITVCTVQWGNYCGMGAAYVNRLFDMVKRNLTAGFPGRFVCFTDDAEGLNPDIIVRELPEPGMRGWDNKISLFKAGVFAAGERVCFMDLDTLITGQLDDILSYDGELATLRDFYRPDGLGPAVILWRAGGHAEGIWEAFVVDGRPKLTQGDQEWLQILRARGLEMDILQDLYPGAFCSFKAHCHPMPPRYTAVVCFHGHPRPHETNAEWVSHVWKEGGGMAKDLIAMANEKIEATLANVCANSARMVPWLEIADKHDGVALLIGGAPSIKDKLPEIRARQAAGETVFALNNAAQFLADRGIRPDWQVLIDARDGNLDFVNGHAADRYALASQCHPSLFDELAIELVTLLHLNTEGVIGAIPQDDRTANLLGGGSSVGMVSMGLVYAMGYREIHLFGYDSCYLDGEHHAYEQKANDGQDALDCTVGDRKFKAAGWMLKQVEEFQTLANALADVGCVITVHGDGLLPHVAHLMANHIQHEEAKKAVANGCI